MKLATGPVSWGVDFADAPGNPPWEAVLDGAAAAGYRGVELGPLGYLPEERVGEELDRRGLSLVGGFVFEPLADASRRREIVARARRVAQVVARAGGRHLVIIDLVDPVRARTAGRSEAAPRLDGARVRRLRRTIAEVAAIAEGAGLVPAIHPHAGSWIEFGDEIEAVADLAPLCLDTGHLAFAGLDPVEAYRRYADRTALIHLKDVDRRVRDSGLDFWSAVAAGVFCPVGAGMVDVPALGDALRGYDGWATVEQDRAPGGDPVADLVASRRALEAVRA